MIATVIRQEAKVDLAVVSWIRTKNLALGATGLATTLQLFVHKQYLVCSSVCNSYHLRRLHKDMIFLDGFEPRTSCMWATCVFTTLFLKYVHTWCLFCPQECNTEIWGDKESVKIWGWIWTKNLYNVIPMTTPPGHKGCWQQIHLFLSFIEEIFLYIQRLY